MARGDEDDEDEEVDVSVAAALEKPAKMDALSLLEYRQAEAATSLVSCWTFLYYRYLLLRTSACVILLMLRGISAIIANSTA